MIRIFWTDAAYRADCRRTREAALSRAGAWFDPDALDPHAVRIACAAYHGVAVSSIHDATVLIKAMRRALKTFGEHCMRPAPQTLDATRDEPYGDGAWPIAVWHDQ